MKFLNEILKRILRIFIINNELKNFIPNKYNRNQKTDAIIFTSTSSNWSLTQFDYLLASELNRRGYNTILALCDEHLDICQEFQSDFFGEKFSNIKKKMVCNTCYRWYESILNKQKIPFIRFSDFNSNKIIQSSEISENAKSATIRFLGKGNVDFIKEPIYKKFLKTSENMFMITNKILDKYKPKTVICHHGIYVPQGCIADVVKKKKGINLITYGLGYRKGTFLFANNDTYHRTMISEKIPLDILSCWDKKKENKILDYLHTRRDGSNDWIKFQHNKNDNFAIKNQNKYSQNVLMITNVIWDAQLHFKHNVFKNMIEWIIETIKFYKINKDKNLIIRIHPAEVLGTVKSKQRVYDEICTYFNNNIPDNIQIIKPEDKINTYDLIPKMDLVLVYGSKMGIEIPCYGIKTLIIGESWARNKGFTTDISTIDEYFKILQTKQKKMNAMEIKRARAFAYYFFFRKLIQINFIKNNNFLLKNNFNLSDQKKIKNDKGLKLICKNIIENKNF